MRDVKFAILFKYANSVALANMNTLRAEVKQNTKTPYLSYPKKIHFYCNLTTFPT
eukprot:c7171_g1_i1 orf=20-184(-)